MKIFEYIDRLNRIHYLIKKKQTGSPKNLAEKLGISLSHLHNMIAELKERGAPINYCRVKRAYYYKNDFELKIQYEFITLTESEQQISAGRFKNIFHNPLLLDCTQLYLYCSNSATNTAL